MRTYPVQSHGCFALDHLHEEDLARVLLGHALQVGKAHLVLLQPGLDQSTGPLFSMIPHIRAVVTVGFPPGAFTELSIRPGRLPGAPKSGFKILQG